MSGKKGQKGRPKALTPEQIREAEQLSLAGEGMAKIAARFKIGVASIHRNIGKSVEEVKGAAQQLVLAEQRIAGLPVGLQISARMMADELKAISTHLASAAKFGSMTANRLNGIAHEQTDQLDPAEPLEVNAPVLRSVMAFTEGANKAAMIGLNLLGANKDAVREANNVIDLIPEQLPNDAQEASRAYQRMLGSS